MPKIPRPRRDLPIFLALPNVGRPQRRPHFSVADSLCLNKAVGGAVDIWWETGSFAARIFPGPPADHHSTALLLLRSPFRSRDCEGAVVTLPVIPSGSRGICCYKTESSPSPKIILGALQILRISYAFQSEGNPDQTEIRRQKHWTIGGSTGFPRSNRSPDWCAELRRLVLVSTDRQFRLLTGHR